MHDRVFGLVTHKAFNICRMKMVSRDLNQEKTVEERELADKVTIIRLNQAINAMLNGVPTKDQATALVNLLHIANWSVWQKLMPRYPVI